MYRKTKNEKDVRYILDNLRAEDIEECKVVHGKNWKEETFNQIINSDIEVLLGINSENHIPVCMGGVYPTDEKGVGIVWMLSTPDIANHKISLLRELKKEFKKYDREYWFLYNFIYSENQLAKNWLGWMGFKFDLARPYGLKVPEGFEFFYRIRKNKKGLLD